jgi:hypothetical protein
MAQATPFFYACETVIISSCHCQAFTSLFVFARHLPLYLSLRGVSGVGSMWGGDAVAI